MGIKGRHDKKSYYQATHEVKRTHYKMWKSGKKWLYGATVLLLSVGSFSGMTIPFINSQLGAQQANAATGTTATLPTSGSVTAPNSNYNSGSFAQNIGNTAVQTQSNWNNLTNATGGNSSGFDSGGWLTQNFGIIYSSYNWGMSNFNPMLNMASPLNFSLSEKNNSNTTLNITSTYGNWQGIYFIPSNTSSSQITTAGNQANGINSTYGLGVAGIPNSVFAGRDFFYNSSQKDYLGNGFTTLPVVGTVVYGGTRAGNQIAVRTTDGSGALTAATSSTTADAGDIPQGGETISVQWTPSSITYSSNGVPSTVTGTLKLTVGSAAVTYPNIVMQAQMMMGLNSSNGGWSSIASYNIPQSSFSANQVGNITVNYVGTRKDGSTVNLGSATINNANYGDKFGVVKDSSSAVAGDTYDYIAPQFAGYNFSSAAAVTVNAATNTITVNYTQQPTAYWNWNWAYNTFGTLPPASSLAALSATASSAGMAMPIPSGATSLNPTPGYHIAAYRYYANSSASISQFWADNTSLAGPGASQTPSYSTLSSAASAAVSAVGGVMGSNTMSSVPTFNVNPGAAYYQNYFAIYIEANKENAAVKYAAAPGNTVPAGALPASQAVSNGYGGYVGVASYSASAVTSSGIPAGKYSAYTAVSDANFSVAALSSGYEYQGITAPDGKEYTGYTNFVAPSNTKTGSVTLYSRNTTTGVISSSNATIPAITVGNNFQLTSGGAWGNYLDTTSYGSLAAGSTTSSGVNLGYGSSLAGTSGTASNATALLQTLGFVFPYGESGAEISNNNTFTVDVQPWQKLDYNGSYVANTPGTSGVAGSLYGNFDKISGYLSNSTGAILASEASSAGSAGKAGWLNYTSAVNSAASAAGASPVFSNAGTNSAAASVAGYAVSLVAYNSAGTSSYYPATTSSAFSAAASYAGSLYTSVLNSAGVEQDQYINLVFTPLKQSDTVNVYYPDGSSKYFIDTDPVGSSYANGTGAPILNTTGTYTGGPSGTLSSFVGGSSASNFPTSYGATDHSYSSTNTYAAVTYSDGATTTSYSATSSMTALAVALSAHPYLDNVSGNVQEFDVTYQQDLTSIYTSDNQDPVPGSQTIREGSWTPVSGLTSYKNTDGTTTTNDVNGATIQYAVYKASDVDSNNNPNAGATPIARGTDASQATKLSKGSYVVIYTVQDAAQKNITASLKLTVTVFNLPFTGGKGSIGVVIAAAAAGLTGLFIRKRGKSERHVPKHKVGKKK